MPVAFIFMFGTILGMKFIYLIIFNREIMKKTLFLIFFAAIVVGFNSHAQTSNVAKETHTFAVKDGVELKLDKYEIKAAGAEKRPCVIYIFGGGFVAGERDSQRLIPFFEFLARSGYVVVSIDYRLGLKTLPQKSDMAPMDFVMSFYTAISMAVEDLFDATAFVATNADAWNVDPAMIVTCGSSAGAITALQAEYMICSGSDAVAVLPEGFNYAGVISMAGAILSLTADIIIEREPCPIMMFHGDADSNVPYDRLEAFGGGFYGSKAIAQMLGMEGLPYWFWSVGNAGHEIADTPRTANREEIISFMNKFVKGRQPLMIDTSVSEIGKPAVNKNFTLADFINANFNR